MNWQERISLNELGRMNGNEWIESSELKRMTGNERIEMKELKWMNEWKKKTERNERMIEWMNESMEWTGLEWNGME